MKSVAVDSLQDPVFSGGAMPTGDVRTVRSPYNGIAVGEVTTVTGDDIAGVLGRGGNQQFPPCAR